MRNLYLVRHGQVYFPDGVKRCIGRTEYYLNETGKEQAKLLGIYLEQTASGKKNGGYRVFSSPLKRAKETAELMSEGKWPVQIVDELKEMDMGEWENIPLKDIRKTLESEPIYGESRRSGLKRFQKAVETILAKTEGDIICVAHAGINCCFLADIMGIPLDTSRTLPQPYGGFSRIEVESEKLRELKIAELGRMPQRVPGDIGCRQIWEHYHTPEAVRAHCVAVCRKADELAEQMQKKGHLVDWPLVHNASLLHDVARAEENHAMVGAEWICREGYPEVAEIIRRHHDWKKELLTEKNVVETAIVYLSDKYVLGDRDVSLKERFDKSWEHCMCEKNPEAALAAWEERYCQAKGIEAWFFKMMNM